MSIGWRYEPYRYAQTQADLIRSSLIGAGIEDAFEWNTIILPALSIAAAEYLANVRYDRELPDYNEYTRMRAKVRSDALHAIERFRDIFERNGEVAAALDRLANEPARFPGDSAVRGFAEAYLAGSVKERDFELEMFHRVLDRYEQRVKKSGHPLPFERSHKDKHFPRSKSPGPVKRFRRDYLKRVVGVWADAKSKEIWDHPIDQLMINFVTASTEPVLELAKQPLSERSIEHLLRELKRESMSTEQN